MKEDEKAQKVPRYSQNLLQGLEYTAISTCFYTILHATIKQTTSHQFLPDASSSIFLLNASLSGLFGLRSLFAPEYREDVIDGYPTYSTAFLSLFGGYAIYDLARLAVNRDVSADLCIHHVLGLFGVLGTMTARKLVFLPAASMVDEFSLVSVWWLNRVKKRGDVRSIQRASLLRLSLTLLLRTFTVPSLLLMEYSLIKRQVRLRHARQGQHRQVGFVEVMHELSARVPAWILCANLFNGSVFTVLNLYWTAIMIRNHKRQSAPRLRHG